MPERRPPSSNSLESKPTRESRAPVRRNLFHQHLSRRPTTSSTSTSTETLRLDISSEQEEDPSSSEIVIRDKNGDVEFRDFMFQGLDVDMMGDEETPDGMSGNNDGHFEDTEKERKRLADTVRMHLRDRNRAPSEPAELLDAVRASLRAKTMALAEDNWMYEAEDGPIIR